MTEALALALALTIGYLLGRRTGRLEGFGAGVWVGELEAANEPEPEVKAKASMDPEHLAVQRRNASLQ